MKIILCNLLENIGIGDKTKNNGILFLVSTGNREVRIEVGSGLEGRITDGKAGRILDNYVLPYFKNDDWNNGIRNGFNAILKEICTEYNITIDSAEKVNTIQIPNNIPNNIIYTGFLVLLISLISRIFINKTSSKFLFGSTLSIIASIIDCSIIGSFSGIFIFLFINFVFMLVGLFSTSSGSGYYGGGRFHSSGGSHGGGGHFSGGRSK